LGNPKKSFVTFKTFQVLFTQTSDYYVISEEANCNCCTAAYLYTFWPLHINYRVYIHDCRSVARRPWLKCKIRDGGTLHSGLGPMSVVGYLSMAL